LCVAGHCTERGPGRPPADAPHGDRTLPLTMMSLTGSAIAAEHAYTQGTVSTVASIKVMPGQMDAYMN